MDRSLDEIIGERPARGGVSNTRNPRRWPPLELQQSNAYHSAAEAEAADHEDAATVTDVQVRHQRERHAGKNILEMVYERYGTRQLGRRKFDILTY